MKRTILVFITFIFALTAFAQIKQDVIASAGGYNPSTGISISWTLGETIVTTFTASDNTIKISNGFQPQLYVTAVEENIETGVKITVYPNPASDIVNIRFDVALDQEVKLLMISSQGKPVKSIIIEATTIEKEINLQDLPSGIYYLRLIKGNLSNVYKVVKL
jgi:hypothetical protein